MEPVEPVEPAAREGRLAVRIDHSSVPPYRALIHDTAPGAAARAGAPDEAPKGGGR